MKLNRTLISVVIVIVIIAFVGYYFFQNRNQKSSSNSRKNEIAVNENQNVEAIVFTRNITFEVPNNSVINMDSSPNSVIILDKSVSQYNPGDYQDLLAKKAIIIQSFPPLNKNKEIFQNYINERYKATDKITPSIKFATANNGEKAMIKIAHQDDNLDEYVEVINLDSPVIIASSEKTKELTKIASTIKNITNSSEEVTQIRKELQLVGSLLRANLTSDLYTQFITKAKKSMSKDDLQSSLDSSKETLKGTISVNGGIWLKAKNQFVSKPDFKNLGKDKKEVKKGQLVLEKEGDKWLIASLNIPED